jgi:predicted transcriptional regulator of viral defense system
MSTGYKNITAKRLSELAQTGEKLFHTGDLAVAWGIRDLNNLYATLSRYAAAGLLKRIYKGLYSFDSVDKLNSDVLGVKALHKYAYLSLQTVLFREGYISQPSQVTTFISSVSRRFKIGQHQYIVRQLSDRALFNPLGVTLKDGVFVANASRAIADLFYFNSLTTIDTPTRVNWQEVRSYQNTLGYPITHRYDHP